MSGPTQNLFPGVFSDVRLLIRAVWTEAAANFRDAAIKRVNWANMIEDQNVIPPYLVIDISEWTEVDYGMDNLVFSVTVHLWYITREDSTNGPRAATLAEDIEERLSAFSRALVNPGSVGVTFNTMQLDPSGSKITVDVTSENEVNTSILAADMELYGGKISFTVLTGEPVYVGT
jgi:hypothetical protein